MLVLDLENDIVFIVFIKNIAVSFLRTCQVGWGNIEYSCHGM